MRRTLLVSALAGASAQSAGLTWEFDNFGAVISHTCGVADCQPEASFLIEEIQSPACAKSPPAAHKVSLVLDGGNINDGTFNQLAYEGGIAACTMDNDCCLEVDRVDDDVESPLSGGSGADVKFFCEVEYASMDSELTIGVGFLHEQAVHRAGFCAASDPTKHFAIVDVAYFGTNSISNTNVQGLQFADDQAGYLAGVIGGGVANLGGKKLGVIGGLPIPPVMRFIQGFINGAKSVCPTCTTTVIYCPFGGVAEAVTGLSCPGEFADIAFGVGVAKYFLGQNVDVIFGAGGPTGSSGIKYASAPINTMFNMTFSTGYIGAKTEAGTPYVIGVDQDEYYTTFESGAWPGANKLITSALKRVDVGVSTAIATYFANPTAPVGANIMLDATNGGVGFAEAHGASSNAPYFGPITPAITASANAVFTQMALGTFQTLVNADGTEASAPPSPSAPPPAPVAGTDTTALIIAIVAGVIALGVVGLLGFMYAREKQGKPVFRQVISAPKPKLDVSKGSAAA